MLKVLSLQPPNTRSFLSLTAAARISPGKGLEIQSLFYNGDVRAHQYTKLNVKQFRKNMSLGSFQRKEDLYTPARRAFCEHKELNTLTTKEVFWHKHCL